MNDKRKGKFAAAISVLAVLACNFALMAPVLATAPETTRIQTVKGNTVVLHESASAQKPDINAISKEQAAKNAMAKLESMGFDIQDFKDQPMETRYIEGTAPAGDPVWVVIFRDDQEGYAYVFGDQVNDETREKLDAVGKVEECTDGDGTPGLRAQYSYTRYTLVEINGLNGQYIRHGETIVDLGQPLNLDEAHWVPTTEEDWDKELQEQKDLQKKMEK